jgi:hypothetical protein
MPIGVTVTGCFTRNDRPVQGLVRFVPERLWVIEGGITWACLAPMVLLDGGGRFEVKLTPTDADSVPWWYIVETPVRAWRFRVYKGRDTVGLKELLGEHHPRPRP